MYNSSPKEKEENETEKYWEEIKLPNLSNFWKTKVPSILTNHLGTL